MTIKTFDNCHFPKIHGGLQQDKGVLGHVGSMSSHVFPLFEFTRHVMLSQFLDIIDGKSMPKIDFTDMNVAYQLGQVAMNGIRSQIQPSRTLME